MVYDWFFTKYLVMKIYLPFLFICIVANAKSQESLKVPDVPFVFKYNESAKLSTQRVNDTLFATVVKQGANFNISLLDKDQKSLCICTFKPSGKQEELETLKTDTTTSRERKMIRGRIVIKWLTPLGENCIAKYKKAFQ